MRPRGRAVESIQTSERQVLEPQHSTRVRLHPEWYVEFAGTHVPFRVGILMYLLGISAITDLAFTVYPSVIIWNLKMPKWTRISTIALMGLGVA